MAKERITNDSDAKAFIQALGAISSRKALYLLVLLVFCFVSLSLFHVWLHVRQTQFNYRLARLYHQNELLLETQRKLRLEWTRFEDPYLLEKMSREVFEFMPVVDARRFVLREE